MKRRSVARMLHARIGALAACGAVALPPATGLAQMVFEQEFEGYSWTNIHAPNPAGAVDMEFLPSGRFIIAIQGGMLRVLNSSGSFRRTMLDIRNEVSNFGDGGLNAILLDPHFPVEPWVYVYYAVETDPGSPDASPYRYGRISRFRLDSSTGYETVVAGTEEILVGATWSEGILLDGPFHTNDCMDWGDDHTLLFSAGDSSPTYRYAPVFTPSFGAGRFDSSLDIGSLRAQSLACYNGKISRIDRETGLGLPSNPFYTGNADDVQSRIWVYGLRNPWRFSVLAGTGAHEAELGLPGALWIGDVGLDWYEELNIAARDGGQNFGWPFHEGPETDHSPFVRSTWSGPIPWPEDDTVTQYAAAIPHASTGFPAVPAELVGGFTASSITGGLFYNYKETAGAITTPYTPALDGKYLFADWGDNNNGHIWIATVDGFDRLVDVDPVAAGSPQAGQGFVDLEYNPATGTIYGLTYWGVYRLDFNPASAPPIAEIAATPLDGPLPLEVTLDASGSYAPSGGTLAYDWKIDGAIVDSTSTPTYATTLTENRNYTVGVVVTNAAMQTAEAETTVFAGNTPPVPQIHFPKPYWTYPDDGTAVEVPYYGTATDPDSATPPETTWRLVLRHNSHRHELLEVPDVLSGTFEMEKGEENTHFLIEFFATDDRGQTTMDSVEMFEGAGLIESAADESWTSYE